MAVKNKKTTKKKIKSKKSNKKIKSFFILAIGICALIYAVYKVTKLIIVPANFAIVEEGRIYSEESATGYVIRNEKVVKGTNYSNGIEQIKAEGEKIAKGDAVYRYHCADEEDIEKEIDELNLKIQEAMLDKNNLFPRDVRAIEGQIENKLEDIKSRNNIQEIAEYKKDIDTYITKKSKISGDLSEAGSYINDLIKQREKYENDLRAGSEYIYAPISGVVSYRVDNLEEELTPSSFENLNEEMLDDLELKTGQIIATSNEMGKVINNYECYIVGVFNSEEAKKASIGKKVTLRLSTQDEVEAKIEYTKEEGKNVLIVFKINECVEKLIDYRKISFDVIWWSYKGLKIPKSAVIYDNGLSYVVRNRGGYYNKILVEILKENDNYCIIDNYDNKDLKALGYSDEEIYAQKTISIYDEIVINPDVELLK